MAPRAVLVALAIAVLFATVLWAWNRVADSIHAPTKLSSPNSDAVARYVEPAV